MTIIRCPRCRDEVSAPAKATRQAIVRCPLCLEEYPLADALRQVPPELIVLGGAAEAEPLTGASSAADTGDAASDYGVAGFTTPGVLEAKPGSGDVALPTRPAITGARPRRKERSAVGELLKVVLGGFVGLTMGLLVLWWVFKTDVGDLGPQVAKYAPWIVPAQLRGQPASSPQPESSGATPVAANSTAQTSKTKGGQPLAPAAMVNDAAEPTSPLEPSTLPDPGFASPLAPASATIDLAALNPPAPSATAPGSVAPAPNLTELLPANIPSAPMVPPAGAAAPPTAPPPTAENFKQAVLTAADALVRYDESGGEDAEARKAKFTEMYLAAGEMGRTISYLSLPDPDLEGSVNEMQILLNKFAGVGGPSKLSGVRFLAATHWRERKQGEGLLVVGHVKDFKAAGPQFEISLDATTRGTPLTIPVVSDRNPQDFCQLEDELVVVGRVIDDPQTNLPGYEGTQPRVLLLGYSVKAPKP